MEPQNILQSSAHCSQSHTRDLRCEKKSIITIPRSPESFEDLIPLQVLDIPPVYFNQNMTNSDPEMVKEYPFVWLVRHVIIER